MNLKIPPTIILLLFGIFMYLLDSLLPFGEFDFFGRKLLIRALCIGAIFLMGMSLTKFFRARTTMDPSLRTESSALVTTGIYAYSRNPMYLAMLLLLLAWGLWLGNAFNTLLAALFVAYMNRFQIKQEETALLRLFGQEYQKYCTQVRRWF